MYIISSFAVAVRSDIVKLFVAIFTLAIFEAERAIQARAENRVRDGDRRMFQSWKSYARDTI